MNEKSIGWRVSSYTAGEGNCVEVGQAQSAILIRDTKNRAAGSLSVSPSAWTKFVGALNR